MQAMRITVKRGRSNVWVMQKRFGDGAWVPADMPVIKQKWRSVDVVGKITETMRNIAAGKLPSCEKFLSSTRPFAGTVSSMMECTEAPAGAKKHLHIAVGCERGLCGVVGANIPKYLTKHLRLADAKKETENELIVLGKKTSSKLKSNLPDNCKVAYTNMKSKMPTFATCLQLTDQIHSADREYDRCTWYYNVYKNTTTFYMDRIDTYSLEMSTKIAGEQFPQYDVEGDERTIMQNLQEFKFATTMYNCMAEQLASEMGSRLASMDSAAKTCKEKSKDYESIYQRLRKTKITNELTVLSVGAKLAKKK